MIATFKKFVREKTWIFLKAKWKLRSGISITVQNDSDWFVFNEIFTNKEYDKAFGLFLPRFSKEPLILDLGANVGYFTLRMADELLLAGIETFSIVSLEASPSNFVLLRQRLDQPLLKNKAKSFLGLAGHRSGSSKVLHSDQHYGHSTETGTGGKVAVVDYVDIESLLQDSSRRIDFLKCDIEGSEEIFLAAYGDMLTRVQYAVFEFHAGECNVDHCRELLLKSGLVSRGVIKTEPAYKTTVEIFSRD